MTGGPGLWIVNVETIENYVKVQYFMNLDGYHFADPSKMVFQSQICKVGGNESCLGVE